MEKELNLNLGGGASWSMPNWLNLDLSAGYDLSKRLLSPIMDASVTRIHASHIFEHLPVHLAFRLLKECHRVLRPKGIIRISMPDCAKFINAVFEKDGSQDVFVEFGKYSTSKLDYLINMGGNQDGIDLPSRFGHYFFWDSYIMRWALITVGFYELYLQEFGRSKDPYLANIATLAGAPGNEQVVAGFDNPRLREVSFYVEAIR